MIWNIYYCDKLFKISNDYDFTGIFHTNRFPDLNALSYTLARYKFKQHLISHGTHTIQEESVEGNITAENLSIGLLTTLFSAYFISRHLASRIVFKNRDNKITI